jgi:hypothetical protein
MISLVLPYSFKFFSLLSIVKTTRTFSNLLIKSEKPRSANIQSVCLFVLFISVDRVDERSGWVYGFSFPEDIDYLGRKGA